MTSRARLLLRILLATGASAGSTVAACSPSNGDGTTPAAAGGGSNATPGAGGDSTTSAGGSSSGAAGGAALGAGGSSVATDAGVDDADGATPSGLCQPGDDLWICMGALNGNGCCRTLCYAAVASPRCPPGARSSKTVAR